MVMRLYGGRKTLSGYVSPQSYEKIQAIAEARKVSVALIVATATEWFAEYLAAPASEPPAPPDRERFGIPALPDPRSLVRGSEGERLNHQQQSDPVRSQRWLFERREAKAIAGKRTRRSTTK